MSEFNKIYVNDSVRIEDKTLMLLCFNNGKVLSKSKYALENHTLSLYEDTKDTLSLFYSNGIAEVYEFNTMITSVDGTQLPTIDKNQRKVKTLSKDRILVFIDGILELSTHYDVIENNVIVLNNQHVSNKVHEIIVFASDLNFIHELYTPTSTQTLSDQINLDAIYCKYSIHKTLIFIDGIKVDFNCIEVVDKTRNIIKLNIPQTLDEISSFEIINLLDKKDNTISLNFNTDQGYLTYGPYDDFGNKIPNMYNLLLTFNSQVKILIDNLRPGFIIKAADGIGEALVIDDYYETRQLKCVLLSNFKYKTYTSDKYYFEVPEYKSIVNYLSEYDKRYTFLPEILTVFQRLLLDEIQDSIQRLRDSRSIQKVDSVNINKLLYLLGFNVNIKVLNKKQRRELIEELNEFYRIVGTRNSYNLLNILQNDLKLINMEQLFTPFGSLTSANKDTIYDYKCVVDRGGTNYEILDHLYTLEDPSISGTVTSIDENTGAITGFELTTTQGINEIRRVYTLTQNVANTQFTISSAATRYNYESTIDESSVGFSVGQKLKTPNKDFEIEVTEIDADTKIKSYILTPTSGTNNVSYNAIQLDVQGVTLDIKSTKIASTTLISRIKDPTYLSDNQLITYGTVIYPGTYHVKASGGAGGGGAARYESHHTTNAWAKDGKNGELIDTEVIITEPCIVSYAIGEGGKGGWVNRTKVADGTGGSGYQSGKAGSGGRRYSHNDSDATNAAGGGGGSTYIVFKKVSDNSIFKSYLARGGAGGDAYAYRWKGGSGTAIGGFGGNASSDEEYASKGAAGGVGRVTDYGETTADTGENGTLVLELCNYNYSGEYKGNIASIQDGTVQRYQTSYQTLVVTAVTENNKKVPVISPIPGHFNENLIGLSWSPTIHATFSLTSIPTNYNYTLKTNNLSGKYLKVGSILKTNTNPVFTYTVTNIDSEDRVTGTYEPTAGTIYCDFTTDAYQQTGTGGKIAITSTKSDQSDTDRCYIDFYKKEQLGAIQHEEYRINKTDYLTITEGTPHSPIWWIPGEPDIDYGYIDDDTESIIPENYGLITTKVQGEWVQWWEWDRQSIWYPTNHIDVEIKLPTDANFKEYMETFIEQFYNLASTVVFIHQVTESFIFGNENETGDSDSDSIDKEIASFGVALGAPHVDYEFVFTSNPHVQYHQTIPSTCTLTIIPTPADAVVTMNGQTTNTLTVNYGEEIEWTVEKSGYKSRDVIRKMTEDATKYVILEPQPLWW